MDRWARAFELHKFPEISDMKPSEMMRQIHGRFPPPPSVIDHIISQDFKDCTKMAEYADKLYGRRRRGNTVTAVNANYEATINAVSDSRRRENLPHDRHGRLPGNGSAVEN